MSTLERDPTTTIDLVRDVVEDHAADPEPPPEDEEVREPLPATTDPAPPMPPRAASRRPAQPGLRIRRVRLRSVATIATVFFSLGYVTVVGTSVAIWNVAVALGFVDTLEATVTDALGLQERFTLVGEDLFSLVAVGAGLVMAFGLVLTILLALVYNVASAAFGGLAIELGPLRRPHRVFSLRQRRFITVRW